jgi:5-(carboxyamino)imidazole ribonucleotide synthase
VRLGVVGGGQLGRFFVRAARDLGHTTVVLDPDPHCPAALDADVHVCAGYDGLDAAAAFAQRCDAVTVEFENLPAACLELIAGMRPTRPSPATVAVVADRRTEKALLRAVGLPLPDFEVIETQADIDRIVASRPFGDDAVVVKTARLGYDGKGQVRVLDRDGLGPAWAGLGSQPCVVERLVPLDRELSIVLARTTDGATAVYPPTVNAHVDGILDTSVVAPEDPLGDEARAMALRIAERLEYAGVLAVEFLVSDGTLLVNEVAPRPHNSGHWTLDGAPTSQFAQQVRVLADHELGAVAPTHRGIAMVNLLGDLWAHGEPRWEVVDGVAGASLHLYGKRDARPGRKMGHVTVLRDDPDEALATARELRSALVGA